MTDTILRSAVIGYGATYKISRVHPELMRNAGIEFVAVCDVSEERLAQAVQDFPGIRTYSRTEELLAQPDIDLVTVITPHNSHAALGMQVMASGKHCVLEKPMCIHVNDAKHLIRQSRDQGVMLSVFHNRRWDDWYVHLQELVGSGILGQLFHIEMAHSGYHPPRNWWRSDKSVSGGSMYDWGAHMIDWLLGLVPGPIQSIRAYGQKRLFFESTNEDQLDSIIQFHNGTVVYLHHSSIARVGKPRLRILGTKGALVDHGDGKFLLYRGDQPEEIHEETILYSKKNKYGEYYSNIADHLMRGRELAVQPEQAMRVVAVLETIRQSAEEGKELPVPFEINHL